MLQIRKKLQNVFKHFDTDLGDFLLSKGYFKIDKGIFQIIEDGGARRMLYSLSEITIYDDTASGFPETFLTDVALYNRLFELGYNLIDYNGVNPSTPTVYATESPIDAPFTGSNTFELPLNYILISVFLDVDLRIKAEYIRTPTGIIILDTLVDGNIISIRGFIASGSVVGGYVISVSDDDNGVVSVDNSDPTNPIVNFNGVYVDGSSITGSGTSSDPLISVGGGGGGVTINDTTPSSTQTYSSEKSEDTFVKRSGTEVGKPINGDLEVDEGGLISAEVDGVKSRIYEKEGKWFIQISDGIDNPIFEFNPTRGFIASKLFDLENDENAYLQLGHITTALIKAVRPLKTVNGNDLDGTGNIVISGGGAVDSVNGQTGVVVLDTSDITETTDKNYVTDAEKLAITHSNRATLDSITEAFTTALKSAYDNTVSGLSTLLATGSRLITTGEITKLSNTSGVNTGDQDLSGKQDVLGFTPENVANKKTTLTNNDTDYPTTKVVTTALTSKQDVLIDTNFGTFTNSVATKNTQADTDILAYVDATNGKWVKQTFSKLVDYLKGFFQTSRIIVTSNITAVNGSVYHNNGTVTYTDPTGVTGMGYYVYVAFGTATIGSTTYAKGSYIFRAYDGTSWNTEIIKNGIGQKIITGNVTLNDTYHNCIVLVKNTATITVPYGLTISFNCVFDCWAGATATFVQGTNVDVIETALTLSPLKMASLYQDSSTKGLTTEVYKLKGETS